jgi:hypothetical protein
MHAQLFTKFRVFVNTFVANRKAIRIYGTVA